MRKLRYSIYFLLFVFVVRSLVSVPAGHNSWYLDVQNGSGSDFYFEGDTVSVAASVLRGRTAYHFAFWTTEQSDTVSIDPFSSITTFTMPAEAVTLTAVSAKLESWFDIGVEDVSNDQYILPERPTHGSPLRFPIKIRLSVNHGSYVSIEDAFESLEVYLEWLPTSEAVANGWQSDELLKFWTAESGGSELSRAEYLPHVLFENVSESVLEATIWYSGEWSEKVSDDGQTVPSPEVDLSLELYSVISNDGQTDTRLVDDSSLELLKAESFDWDDDGMPDSWEIQNNLDHFDPADALTDADGDRIPNLWEYKHGTDPNLSSSVSGSSTTVALVGGDYTSLQAAYEAAADYAIIEVKSGTYYGSVGSLEDQKNILWLAELSGSEGPVVIEGENGEPTARLYGDVVMDGFIISHKPGEVGRGVSIYYYSNVRLINCLINGNTADSGAAIYNLGSDLSVIHSTLTENTSTNKDKGLILQVRGPRSTTLINSIVWNEDHLGPEMENQSSGHFYVYNSIVRGGDFGGIDEDPLLTVGGWLTSDSPAIDRSSDPLVDPADIYPTDIHPLDIYGQIRPLGNAPDLGCVEFSNLDSDLDSLPDWWEIYWFGDLVAVSELDIDGGDYAVNTVVSDSVLDANGNLLSDVIIEPIESMSDAVLNKVLQAKASEAGCLIVVPGEGYFLLSQENRTLSKL